MKNSLLILAGAAALSLASCSQEKTSETTVATDGAATTTTTTTTTTPLTDAQIEARAQRIADKMVANMKITDEATKTKIRTVYVNRYKRMNELRTKYTTDTTGMAVAMRDANMAVDQEFKTVFTDPTQYQVLRVEPLDLRRQQLRRRQCLGHFNVGHRVQLHGTLVVDDYHGKQPPQLPIIA